MFYDHENNKRERERERKRERERQNYLHVMIFPLRSNWSVFIRIS